MEHNRVVEVLHDLGEGASPRWKLGSGFVVRTHVVLTAAHNLGDEASQCGPEGTTVRCLSGEEYKVARVLVRNDDLDLAILVVPGLQASSVVIGRISRDQMEVLEGVSAVGFPNFKHAVDRPTHRERQPAQPFGSVPTAENLPQGVFVLKLSGGEPAAVSERRNQESGNGSPWSGLSGAGVFVGNVLVGIAIEHHTTEGLGSLHIRPIVPNDSQNVDVALLAALAITEVESLPFVNPPAAIPVDDQLRDDLVFLKSLEDEGLLEPGDARSLRIERVKFAKGWT